MARTVSKSEFKPRALEFFREVQRTGEPLVITERGTPVLKIVRYEEEPESILKARRGSVVEYVGPTEPVGWEDWEGLH